MTEQHEYAERMFPAPVDLGIAEPDRAVCNVKYGTSSYLEGEGGAKIALSAEYQGRVLTSAVSDSGRSLGWLNRGFIEAKKTGTQFDNYGGEDRFWLGPEAGQYGLYFAPNAKFEVTAWQTPHQMQEGAWDVA